MLNESSSPEGEDYARAPNQGSSGHTLPAATADGSNTEDVRWAQKYDHNSTRYLCAAVQTDPRLCRRLIRNLLHDPRRSIADAPGVDTATVLKYALAADRRWIRWDLLIAPMSIYSSILLAFECGEGIPWVDQLGSTCRIGPWSDFNSTFHLEWILLCCIPIIAFAELLISRFRVVAPNLRQQPFRPDDAPEPRNEAMARRVKDIADRDRGNVVVFNGYHPFNGSESTFSPSLKIAPAAPGEQVTAFTVHELYNALENSVSDSDLTVERRLFVNGRDLLDREEPLSQELLPDPQGSPASHVGADFVERVQERRDRVRSYLMVRAHDMGDNLITTVFVQLWISPGDVLYIEITPTLLGPIKRRYQEVDQLSTRPTWRCLMRLAGRAVLDGLVRTPGSVLALLLRSSRPVLRYLESRKSTSWLQEAGYGYGPTFNLRVAVSANKYDGYFQERDGAMGARVIVLQLFHGLIEFLTDHHVDVSDLKEHRTTILNSGIFVSDNGSLTLDKVAFGEGSKVMAGRAGAKPKNQRSAKKAGR